MRRALFIDRDGTINIEKGYLYKIQDFEFIPGVVEALSLLKKAGFLLIVVTNQSGVARGYYQTEDVEKLHNHVDKLLESKGVFIDGWYYCQHYPGYSNGVVGGDEACFCRKPSPGMLLMAATEHSIDLKSSFMIGDKLADIEAGIAAGCCSILVRSGYGYETENTLPKGVAVFDDLLSAAKDIVKRNDRV